MNGEWGETGKSKFMDAKCIASPKRAVKKKFLKRNGSHSQSISLVGGPKSRRRKLTLHGNSSNVVFRPNISTGLIIPDPDPELDRDPPEPEFDEREDGAGEVQSPPSPYAYEGEEEEEAVVMVVVGSVSW